jgi:putative inorganic carbon (hco3(-)) transporter
MRDLILFLLLLAIVVVTPRRPIIGALAWVLFGVMNPHRLAWGHAYDFPFAMVIALVTMLGLVVGKSERGLKGGAAAVLLLVFLGWSVVTTLGAFNPDEAQEYLSKWAKTALMTLVVLAVVQTRQHVVALVAVLVFALGFYGTKGGVFVLSTGGAYMVNGPPESLVSGNNEMGVALTMIIPLMYFLHQQVERRWLRWLLMTAMALCAISVIGAYSRGAMLAIASMALLLWFRSRNKFVLAIVCVGIIGALIPAMPQHWFEKMDTLRTYREDASANGRLVSWQTATNIAVDRFPTAGGFEWHGPQTSLRYSPDPNIVYVAHSIYFQTLGSQGFIGLALFLLFWFLVWRQCGWLRRHCRGHPDQQWAYLLGSMVQVALVGYAVGGAFLDLAFWDFPYYLYAAVAGAKYVIQRQAAEAVGAAAGDPGMPTAAPPVGPDTASPLTGRPVAHLRAALPRGANSARPDPSA